MTRRAVTQLRGGEWKPSRLVQINKEIRSEGRRAEQTRPINIRQQVSGHRVGQARVVPALMNGVVYQALARCTNCENVAIRRLGRSDFLEKNRLQSLWVLRRGLRVYKGVLETAFRALKDSRRD